MKLPALAVLLVAALMFAATAVAARPKVGTYMGSAAWQRADVFAGGRTMDLYFRSPKCTPGSTVAVGTVRGKEIKIAKDGSFAYNGGAKAVNGVTGVTTTGKVTISGRFPTVKQLTASVTYRQGSCKWTGTLKYKYAGSVA
jgi:hypothetical protein